MSKLLMQCIVRFKRGSTEEFHARKNMTPADARQGPFLLATGDADGGGGVVVVGFYVPPTANAKPRQDFLPTTSGL